MHHTSPITNCWGSARTTVVPTEEFIVFAGKEGALYNHHHQLASLDGRLFAAWSTADVHEDSPGQRMMLAVSDDEGETWSDARPLIDRKPGKVAEAVLTSTGLHVHDGRMMAYWGYFQYTEEGLEALYRQTTGICGRADTSIVWHHDVFTGISVSDDGGDTWHDEGRIDNITSYISPHKLASGRLVLPGNNWYPWTDDPYGIEGWTVAALPGLPEGYIDDPQGIWVAMEARGSEFSCNEGSCFQTDDGVVHMMIRSELDRLVVAESHDNGVTYSEPILTDFTDCHSRFHFGRLPDGRYFATSTPDPESYRTPLILATSDDGVRFDRHYVLGAEPDRPPRAVGIQKFGRYGYPSYHIVGDTMFVIYSIAKEDIAVTRLPLKALD
jgi:hypothetical protein